jgi:ATP sulfurylase
MKPSDGTHWKFPVTLNKENDKSDDSDGDNIGVASEGSTITIESDTINRNQIIDSTFLDFPTSVISTPSSPLVRPVNLALTETPPDERKKMHKKKMRLPGRLVQIGGSNGRSRRIY